MQGIIIEQTSIKRIDSYKRIIYYSYFIKKSRTKSFEEILAELDGMLEKVDYSRPFNMDVYVSDDNICELLANQSISDNEKIQTERLLDKLVRLIKKESKWERKVHSLLEDEAKKHPIVSKTIVAILIGILTSLLTDIVYDAVKNNDKDIVVAEVIYLKCDDGFHRLLLEDGVIDETIVNDVVIRKKD